MQGPWLLPHCQHWTLIETLQHPAVALSHRGPVAMGPQEWSLHVLQHLTDGEDAGVSQLKVLVLSLGSN